MAGKAERRGGQTLQEGGFALILVISLLAVMSLLAALLAATATSELQLAGNYRSSQEAFYAADRAVEYACETLTGGSGRIDLYPGHLERIATEHSGLEAPEGGESRNIVEFLGAGPPPPGSGTDASLFQAHRYAVRAVGISPTSGKNPARCEVRAQVARIVPN